MEIYSNAQLAEDFGKVYDVQYHVSRARLKSGFMNNIRRCPVNVALHFRENSNLKGLNLGVFAGNRVRGTIENILVKGFEEALRGEREKTEKFLEAMSKDYTLF